MTRLPMLFVDGSELVGTTEKEFREVARNVERSSGLVGEISAASLEQAQGIEQINKAVSEMDKVVQRNAATAEESASASGEMNAQANQMKHRVEELERLICGTNGMANIKVESARAKEPVARRFALSDTSATKANGHPGKRRAPAATPPEQLIPLDDERIADF